MTQPADHGIPFHTQTEYQVKAEAMVKTFEDGRTSRDTLTRILAVGLREMDNGLRRFNTPGSGGKRITAQERAARDGRAAIYELEDQLGRGDLGPEKGHG